MVEDFEHLTFGGDAETVRTRVVHAERDAVQQDNEHADPFKPATDDLVKERDQLERTETATSTRRAYTIADRTEKAVMTSLRR